MSDTSVCRLPLIHSCVAHLTAWLGPVFFSCHILCTDIDIGLIWNRHLCVDEFTASGPDWNDQAALYGNFRAADHVNNEKVYGRAAPCEQIIWQVWFTAPMTHLQNLQNLRKDNKLNLSMWSLKIFDWKHLMMLMWNFMQSRHGARQWIICRLLFERKLKWRSSEEIRSVCDKVRKITFCSPQVEELLDTGGSVYSHDFRLFSHDLYGTYCSHICGKRQWLWLEFHVSIFFFFLSFNFL